jgi:hypothetical protein
MWAWPPATRARPPSTSRIEEEKRGKETRKNIGKYEGIMVIILFLSTMRSYFSKCFTKTVLAPLIKLIAELKLKKLLH